MVQLGELAEIVSGSNIVRLSESQQDRKYTTADFEHDFYMMKLANPQNAIIYQQSSSMPHMSAAILSDANKEKVISQIFAIIRIDVSRLNPWYLCYLLNQSQMIAHQYSNWLQGSVIVRFSAQLMKGVKIPLPDMTVQQNIGKLYATALYQNYLEVMQAKRRLDGVLSVLRDMDEQKGDK
ncbi:restriction endonuclease subunit S [uncultured Mitsuokella sp.]|uniref:restriction endonuclease subunit S n=1 Tax=uncultured Mitsuokella sp. TaxID=453120 RepID=UPI00261D372A|nr:restriction endonuclease subunit S [uncultured Mitsuokella sp.]